MLDKATRPVQKLNMEMQFEAIKGRLIDYHSAIGVDAHLAPRLRVQRQSQKAEQNCSESSLRMPKSREIFWRFLFTYQCVQGLIFLQFVAECCCSLVSDLVFTQAVPVTNYEGNVL